MVSLLIKACLLFQLPHCIFLKIIINLFLSPKGHDDVLFISVAPTTSSIMEHYTHSINILYNTYMYVYTYKHPH